MGAQASQEELRTWGRQFIAAIDRCLEEGKVKGRARALLLLRLCQGASLVRRDRMGDYWNSLVKARGDLPAEHAEAYAALEAAMAAPEHGYTVVKSDKPALKQGGFAAEMLEQVAAAVQTAKTDPGQARQALEACQQRLKQRWWPFGKGLVWAALIDSWAAVDRKHALTLIAKLPAPQRRELLLAWNKQCPLTPEEWDLAHKHEGMFNPCVVSLIADRLDLDDPGVSISGKLAEAVALGRLLPEVHVTSPDDSQAREFERRREKALERYYKLVGLVAKRDPASAHTLMAKLFEATVQAARFNQLWPDRLSALRQIINVWVTAPELRETGLYFIRTKPPAHLRDMCLAQWCAMAVTSGVDAPDRLQFVLKEAQKTALAEAWFLVTLVRRGFAKEAMQLARGSSRAGELVPRIRRAWLCEQPETASEAITEKDLEGDIVGQFLLRGSDRERARFLRELTQDGQTALPPELWGRMDISLLLPGSRPAASLTVIPALYSRDEKQDEYFSECVRMFGFGGYFYDAIDPLLMRALVVWDDESPSGVAAVMRKMWETIRPTTPVSIQDVLRNSIFERCRMVFAARPEALLALFVDWVKKTLVDQPLRYENYAANTVYTLSLKDSAPFLFCLLGAEKVANASAKRCDEILKMALAKYKLDGDLIAAAAQLYASDKGVDAVDPPVALGGGHLPQWQSGVVEAMTRRILVAFSAMA